MQDTETGDGRHEYDGAAGFCRDHVPSASLRDEEGAGEVDVDEFAEHGGVVGFGFDVRAWAIRQRGNRGGCIDRYRYLRIRWAYSTIPAELITISTEPRSEVTFAITSAMAFSSRTSAL